MGIGATQVDHIVIGCSDSAAVAQHFSGSFGLEIKRAMERPGGGHLELMKLDEVILEFAGPSDPKPDADLTASLSGVVLTVEDIDAAVASLRADGHEVTDPRGAVQPGAKLAIVKSNTHGVPFAMIQYNAIPEDSE